MSPDHEGGEEGFVGSPGRGRKVFREKAPADGMPLRHMGRGFSPGPVGPLERAYRLCGKGSRGLRRKVFVPQAGAARLRAKAERRRRQGRAADGGAGSVPRAAVLHGRIRTGARNERMGCP